MEIALWLIIGAAIGAVISAFAIHREIKSAMIDADMI
jgi:hypothetical protein